MSHRIRLANRHDSDCIKIKSEILGGTSLLLHVAPLPRLGTVGEVFISGAKAGSTAETNLCESATLLSMALQYQMPLADYAENIQRDTQGKPLSAFGEVVDALIAEEKRQADLRALRAEWYATQIERWAALAVWEDDGGAVA